MVKQNPLGSGIFTKFIAHKLHNCMTITVVVAFVNCTNVVDLKLINFHMILIYQCQLTGKF